jgi:hypothetical protein
MESEGERRYISYSFMTSALDGGEWSASRHVRSESLRNTDLGTSLCLSEYPTFAYASELYSRVSGNKYIRAAY